MVVLRDLDENEVGVEDKRYNVRVEIKMPIDFNAGLIENAI
ncbi:hypothetical protein [Bartonella koehlerae]|nr:hypothetical protein [Bartonella koehlerae]